MDLALESPWKTATDLLVDDDDADGLLTQAAENRSCWRRLRGALKNEVMEENSRQMRMRLMGATWR